MGGFTFINWLRVPTRFKYRKLPLKSIQYLPEKIFCYPPPSIHFNTAVRTHVKIHVLHTFKTNSIRSAYFRFDVELAFDISHSLHLSVIALESCSKIYPASISSPHSPLGTFQLENCTCANARSRPNDPCPGARMRPNDLRIRNAMLISVTR